MVFPTWRNRFKVVTIVDTAAVHMQDKLHRRCGERGFWREVAVVVVVQQGEAIADVVIFQDLLKFAGEIDVLLEIGVPDETACRVEHWRAQPKVGSFRSPLFR